MTKMYDPDDKFTQPADGIVIITSGPSDEELLEAANRIRQGESADVVYADIDARVAARNAARAKGGTT